MRRTIAAAPFAAEGCTAFGCSSPWAEFLQITLPTLLRSGSGE